MEAATVTPWNLVHGRLPGSGRLPGTLQYTQICKCNWPSARACHMYSTASWLAQCSSSQEVYTFGCSELTWFNNNWYHKAWNFQDRNLSQISWFKHHPQMFLHEIYVCNIQINIYILYSPNLFSIEMLTSYQFGKHFHLKSFPLYCIMPCLHSIYHMRCVRAGIYVWPDLRKPAILVNPWIFN